MRPITLIVAYTTKLAPGELAIPEFKVPASYKKADTIAKWMQEQEERFQEHAARQPYTGTFDTVRIADPSQGDLGEWSSKDRFPFGEKQALSLAVRNWILKRYPEAWPHTTHPYTAKHHHGPDVIFLGFDPRRFLKILGIECSLPENQPKDDGKLNVLPLSMWYGNSDHRDIGEAVKPNEFHLDWNVILKARGIAAKGWEGPGNNSKSDLRLATEFATQLGLLSEVSIEE